MRRREFLTVLGGCAAAFSTRAQPAGVRRLGVLTTNADDPFYATRVAALTEALAALGWKAGGNLTIDWRFADGDRALLARYAEELVALTPDALLAITSPSVEELKRRTRTNPIVFTLVTDPVAQGFVESLARPGGGITGFTDLDLSMAGKWMEMLTEIAPSVATIGIVYNPATAPWADRMLEVLSKAASAQGVTARGAPAGDVASLKAAATPREARAGLIVLPDVFTIVNRAVILQAAARARTPAVYWTRRFVLDGGLAAYGVDGADLHRRPAAYIDRILKGADPGDLPVQNPTKFQLSVNMKTAAALGLPIPQTLLAAADEAIE